ncbi:uncharacterized protein LOC131936765 [Physella acuta]|uniref:uncharacterized protein LOC131936765 n=1 Tax=Physella acuta TaxID=109671 RepID=UPI0027DCDE3B|nr:uncharacterized protein LOC131936765 [Physella acuta]
MFISSSMASCLVYFLLFMFYATRVSGVSTTLGKYFVLQFPPSSATVKVGDTRLLAFTLAKENVDVKVRTPYVVKGKIEKTLVISRGKVEQVTLGDNFRMKVSGKFSTVTLTSSGTFGVCVQLYPAGTDMETFQALPVAGFGLTYIALTLSLSPSIVIVAADVTDVDIRLNMPGRKFTMVIQGQNYTHGAVIKVTLRKEESYFIQQCQQQMSDDEDLTGTRLTGTKPIGVISGSCSGRTLTPDCKSNVTSRGVFAEMLMPLETLGTDFIFIDTIGRKTRGYVIVLASQDNTAVTVFDDVSPDTIIIELAGSTTALTTYKRKPRKMICDKPVACFYVLTSNCGVTETDGDAAVSILVPTTLFYNLYMWISLYDKDRTLTNYVTLVILLKHKNYLTLDDAALDKSVVWTEVQGASLWGVGNLKVGYHYHRAYALTDVTFGCYVYGVATSISYMQPAGYMAAFINKPCSTSQMTDGDLMDNDCDMVVDEELRNNIDDDHDGSVDEDLATEACTLNNGSNCHPKITKPTVRTTTGPASTPSPGADCPRGKYGAKCKRDCSKCDPDCDKTTGKCRRCFSGWRHPERSCKDGECHVVPGGNVRW